jgi:hypothetical protein
MARVCRSTQRRLLWPVSGWRSRTRRDSRVRSSSVHRATRIVCCAWEPWRNGQRARLSRGRLRDHTPSAPLPVVCLSSLRGRNAGPKSPMVPFDSGAGIPSWTTQHTPAWWNGRHATLRTSWAPPVGVQVPPPASPESQTRSCPFPVRLTASRETLALAMVVRAHHRELRGRMFRLTFGRLRLESRLKRLLAVRSTRMSALREHSIAGCWRKR